MKNSIIKFLATVVLMTVISFTIKAQTPVSGGIYSNTTWTKANSPYIVTDTVVVFPGYTLTIQAGVVVKFADNQELEIRQATLIAQGTAADSIIFTSNSATPKAGIWISVYLNNSKYSNLKYCSFHFAKDGISNDQEGSDNDTLIIKNSTFNYNNTGSSNWWIDFNGVVEYDSCNFISNLNGISTEFTALTLINNCQFINNQNSGVSDVGAYLQKCFVSNNKNIGVNVGEINNSIITFNQYGIENSDISNCTVRNNQYGIESGGNIDNSIITNNKYGVDGAGYVKNSIVDSNSISGIFCFGDITNCEVKYNGTGIEIEDSVNTYTENIIEYNTIGILLEAYNHIYCNKICNNSNYDVKYTMSTSINLSHNYWCTTDSATIASHIYDGYDNIKLGIVKFIPIDTTNCFLTGCLLQVSAKVTNATCDTCHNGTATANVINGVAPYTWTWYTSPIQSTQTVKGLKPGTYSVCVTDAKGCSACNNSVIIATTTNCTGFSIAAYDSNATCSTCADGYAWVTVRGGKPPYKYTWFTSPFQSKDTAKGLIHGTYQVCVTDLYGCTACDSVTIQTGHCSAHFEVYPTSTAHVYNAVNMASGVAPLKYLWSWGDGTYDSTAYPSHKYDSAAFYTICLTITDFAGCKNRYCVSYYLKSNNPIIHINVIPNVISGINENNGDKSFNIYPNPANDVVTIDFQGYSGKDKTDLELYNITEELIETLAVQSRLTQLNISDLAKGVYILKIRNYESGITNKLLIKD